MGLIRRLGARVRAGVLPLDQGNHLVTAAIPLLIAVSLFQTTSGNAWAGIGSGLAQSLALSWGRRQPVPTVVAVILIDLLGPTVGAELLGFGVIISGYYAASWGNRWERKTALSLGLAFAVYVGAFAPGHALWIGTTLGAGFLAFWVSGRFEANQRGRISELSEQTDRLAEERATAEQRAADRERALLARELHDILNHSVTGMVLDAEAGAETGTEADARATLQRVADTGRDSLAELRRLLGVLRTSAPDELRPPPSLEQVDELVAQIPAGGPTVTVERHGVVRPGDTSIELAAYRVVQESLTNVAKHAGAVPAIVRLTYLADSLEIVVTNELPRSTRRKAVVHGTGLVGLRERVELLGGSLHAGTSEAGGFTVYATLPLRPRSLDD